MPRHTTPDADPPVRATLASRLRDLLVMGVVGPVLGVAAVASIQAVVHYQHVQAAQVAQAQRESDRALALLEDRPATVAPASTATAPVEPAVPDIAMPSPSPAPDLAVPAPMPEPPPALAVADFGDTTPTPAARHMADWIVSRHDNGRMPFVVLDKRDARLYAFQPDGRLLESTPVLLGQSHGDDTFPGIGDVPINQVKPYQRTTAAGRFVTQPGLDADHTDVVWLDYDAALAMHRVINKVKSERRLQRLASADPKVRRISWGCINIPIDFFDRRISPVFGKHPGLAYVIPETKTFAQVFEKDGAAAKPVVATLAGPETRAPRDVGDR